MEYQSEHEKLVGYRNLKVGLRCSPGIPMICYLKNGNGPRVKFELKLDVTKTIDLLKYLSPI